MKNVFDQCRKAKAGRNAADFCALCLLVLLSPVPHAEARQCRRAVMQGEVNADRQWSESIGEGWVFRVIPIKPSDRDYSGWDLVIDRSVGTGFPDALLLATPPYDSINQREVGTTFGLRAQDVIGWNPRSFRFITDLAEFLSAKKLYFTLHGSRQTGQQNNEGDRSMPKAQSADRPSAAAKELIEIAARSSAGQFRMLDARITPGTADVMPFAQSWALKQRNTPHSVSKTGSSTPLGRLNAIRFEITLWLPGNWKAPNSMKTTLTPCQ